MGFLETVREAVADAGPRDQDQGSKGAWWCMDCRERILDIEVDGQEPPACPGCGEAMEWERSRDGAGCAC